MCQELNITITTDIDELHDQLEMDSRGYGFNRNVLVAEALKEMFEMETEPLCAL